MTATEEFSTLRRKAGAGRPPPDIARPTPERLLAGALAKAGAETGGLVIDAGAVELGRGGPARIAELIAEGMLIALCEAETGARGVMLLDAQALAAVIETLTIGRVSPRPAEPRPPSRTDAALAAEFIDRLLAGFAAAAQEAELPIAPMLDGYAHLQPLPDRRALLLRLDDVPYRIFDAAVALGESAREGRIVIALAHDLPAPRAEAGSARDWHDALYDAVAPAHVRLDAVLARHEMDLAEFMALKPGQTIAIDRAAVGRVTLTDAAGRPVARGRLGQCSGYKALRLVAPEEASAGCAEAPNCGGPAPGLVPPPAPEAPDTPPEPGAPEGLADLGDLGGLGDLGDMPSAEELAALGAEG